MSRKGNFLLALIIGFVITSCISHRELTIDQVGYRQHDYGVLVLHNNNNRYLIRNYSFEDTSLVGNLEPYYSQKGTIIHVYSNTDLIDSTHYVIGNSLSLPIRDIEKIVLKEYEETETYWLVYFCFEFLLALFLGV